jgi:hypothetical protein
MNATCPTHLIHFAVITLIIQVKCKYCKVPHCVILIYLCATLSVLFPNILYKTIFLTPPLLPAVTAAQLVFCQWLLPQCAEDPVILARLLVTCVCSLARDGIMNFHKHVGRNHTRSFHWPMYLTIKITGPRYLRFLCRYFPWLLEDVPLRTRRRMWFPHDAAPAHFSLAVREWLGRHSAGRCIGCVPEDPVLWPPRSPDLNPIDFCLWVSMKNAVHTNIVGTETNFGNAYRMQQTRFASEPRSDACVHGHWAHVEHLLQRVQQVNPLSVKHFAFMRCCNITP